MSIFIENVIHRRQETNLYIEGNRIRYIGSEKREADISIDGKNKAVFPTLVNGHTHAAMTLFRGYGDDMPFDQWLQTKIWPAESNLTEEDVYWGTKLACLEMIKSGTTLFNDMYWHFHGAARATEEMGIRALVSAVFIDLFDERKAEAEREMNLRLYKERSRYSSRIHYALGPHAIYTVSTESLQWIADFARRENLLIHIHLSETQKEVTDCLERHRLRPVEYLEKIGFLGPNVLACHSVWLEEREFNILREHKVILVHNPTSNLKLAGGKIFSYPEVKKREIPFCIGTDGCASNNNLDMLESLKFAALFQKWGHHDPTVLPAHEIWEAATKKAHEYFRIDAGEIAENKLADIMLVNLKNVQMVPDHDTISNLVYAANGGVVDTVICDGKILMRERHIEGEDEILGKISEIAARIGK